MKKIIAILMLMIVGLNISANTPVPLWGQCGGTGFPTQGAECAAGAYCKKHDNFFYQCVPCMSSECMGSNDPDDPDEPGNPNNPATKFEKEVLTGQKLVVISVTGQAAINAGIKIGQILSLDTSAAIKASITADLKDCYRRICYSGGYCNCTAVDWTICATGGCPAAGTSNCNP